MRCGYRKCGFRSSNVGGAFAPGSDLVGRDSVEPFRRVSETARLDRVSPYLESRDGEQRPLPHCMMLLFLVCLSSLFAGFVDSVVGGGGLIQLPAMLILFPSLPIATVFGTNKFASM